MTASRILLDVELTPAIGSRFQPTGFPDLGTAEFQQPDGTHSILVESAQSMANRLEGVAWNTGANLPASVFAGLPYVEVIDVHGNHLTSSRTEAHRLASAFIKDSELDGVGMIDVINERLNLQADTPLDHRTIARALFRLDPFVLVQGVFFADSKWPGQPKVARALSSFIEAHNVRRAESGGVKRDHVRHSIEEGSGGSSEGYGSIPFSRTEWTAEPIVASFSLDLTQLASYGLADSATALLEAIALWEIRSLLDGGLRLRTACDLVPVDDLSINDQSGNPLPSHDELSERVATHFAAAADELGDAGVLRVTWNGGKKKK